MAVADWTGVELRWRGVKLDGSPATGVLHVTADVARFLDDDVSEPVAVFGRTVDVPIDSRGEASIIVPATDDSELSPSGFTYTIVEELDELDGATYSLEVPLSAADTGIELNRVVPVEPSPGTPVSLVTRAEFDALVQQIAEGEAADITRTEFDDVKTTAEAAAPQSELDALALAVQQGEAADISRTEFDAVRQTADAAAPQTELDDVRVTALAAAPQSQLDTLKVTTDRRARQAFVAAVMPVTRRQDAVTTDVTAVTINAPIDVTTYNYNSSALGGVVPANWPVDDVPDALRGIVAGYLLGYNSTGSTPRLIRVMCDGDKFAIYTGPGNGLGAMIYVDGVPTSLTPYTLPNANTFSTITFPNAKPRLIEIRTAVGLVSVYTQKPYTLWKPQPLEGPNVLVMGDSFVQGVGSSLTVNGIYANIGPQIGADRVWVDGVGGTGYGVHSSADGLTGNNRYLDRLGPRTVGTIATPWDIATINPDMFVVHGGGINDLYKGRTVAQVVADATALFTQARAKLPRAKLVFVEGFAPPAFTPATYNANYVNIRQQLQAALANVGVYYIDVATSAPWIAGTGRVGATTGVGNSDVYIGADSAHPVDAGHIYIRRRIAPVLRRILLDDGALLNQLI